MHTHVVMLMKGSSRRAPRLAAGFLCVLLTVGAGCSSGGGAYEVTERQRERLAPSAAALYADLAQAAAAEDHVWVLALCDSLERLAPEFADVPYLRGQSLAEMGHFEAAAAQFERVLALDANYPGAAYELGNLAYRENQFGKAVAFFEREARLLEELLARPDRAGDVPARALPATLLQMGRAVKELNTPEQAGALFERAIAADTSFAEAYFELAELGEESGDLERALAGVRRAYALEPGNVHYEYKLGALLVQAGDAEAALPYLQRAVERRPWFHGALYNMYQVLQRLGRSDEALEYLERSEAMQAIDTEITQARLNAEARPGDVEEWLRLAGLYLSAGRYDEAGAVFGTALALDPGNLQLRNDMGNLSLMRGDAASALQHFRYVLARDSTLADTWLNLGVAHAYAGEPALARHAWQQTLRHEPGHAEAVANLERLEEQGF